jgi:hypothetical protein
MLHTLFVLWQELVENMAFALYCETQRLNERGDQADGNTEWYRYISVGHMVVGYSQGNHGGGEGGMHTRDHASLP